MEDVLNRIVEQAKAGELVFPTNLGGAIRLQQALGDPDCHLDEAAELVVGEPLVSARLVAMAHSVAFTRFGGRITNVRGALSLLGMNALKALVASIVVRQFAASAGGEKARVLSSRLWRHSAHVAALARVIGSRVAKQDADSAVFCGVVHEIAGFYLISRSNDFPVLLGVFGPVDSRAYRQLNEIVLKALKVPKVVVEAALGHGEALSLAVPTGFAQTLALANAMAGESSPFAALQPALPDAAGIDFAVGDSTFRTLIDEAAEDTAAFANELIG